jgi:hypothetical protein
MSPSLSTHTLCYQSTFVIDRLYNLALCVRVGFAVIGLQCALCTEQRLLESINYIDLRIAKQ